MGEKPTVSPPRSRPLGSRHPATKWVAAGVAALGMVEPAASASPEDTPCRSLPARSCICPFFFAPVSMSLPQATEPRPAIEPVTDNLPSVQPGGGFCYRVELAWGRWRRWWLKRFRPGYVRKMENLRKGNPAGAPHEILDPRDLKYCRNRCRCWWDEADDPFAWRERIPFARWGLAELVILGVPLAGLTVLCGWWHWLLALPPGLVLLLVVFFFRDPPRRVPQEPGLVVAPADGRVVEIEHVPHDEFIGGPAIRVGIFLSIFDVHLNRSPARARVTGLRYRPGKFLNALRPRSARENEQTWIGLETEDTPHRRLVVRQISGAIARRIVCALRPGELVDRGQRIGMIKLGSRTDLVLPDDGRTELLVEKGAKVKAGASVVARFCDQAKAGET